MENKKAVKVALTGDSFITNRLPQDESELNQIRSFISEFDVKFTNLEVAVHHFDQSASVTSGGTWAAARPGVLKDLKWLGFNMLACANNHSLDWLHGGLLSTIHHLEKDDWIYAGIGRNLAEASQPKYLETKNGRVALISVTSTYEYWHRAGEQRPDVPGRAGVNPLAHKTIHRVSKESLNFLKGLETSTEINSTRNLNIKEGFIAKNDSSYVFGSLQFEEGTQGTFTYMEKRDANRIAKAISEASRQSDVVLLSVHSHEMKSGAKNKPADFLREFSQFCIDKGAHAVISHGPHILRGIEIYKNRPIFYSLGDFIFQNDLVERQPAEFYDLYNLDSSNTPGDGFDARSNYDTKGLAANRNVFESVIVSFDLLNGRISEIKLTPITLGYEKSRASRGKPCFADKVDGERILKELDDLSSKFGTKMVIKNGKGYIQCSSPIEPTHNDRREVYGTKATI